MAIPDSWIRRAVDVVPRWRFLDDDGVPATREIERLLAALGVEPGDRTLVTAAGCAYTAAVLAALGTDLHAVAPDARRAGRIAALLDRLNLPGQVVTGDPDDGLPAAAPFDGIVLGGRGRIPTRLVDQLAVGGALILCCPGGRFVRLVRLDATRVIGDIVG